MIHHSRFLCQEEAAARPDLLPEDAEFFRELNRTRKAKSSEFLQKPRARFDLLTTLGLVNVLKPITALLFETANADKVQIHVPSEKSHVGRRIRSKSSPQAAEAAQPRFEDVAAVAARAVSRLWSCLEGTAESIFEVAIAFWPASLSASSMYKILTDQILENMAAVKWRILGRVSQLPISASVLQKHIQPDGRLHEDAPPEVHRFVNDQLARLSNMPSCCLDPHWALPVQKLVRAAEAEEDGDPEGCFVRRVADFLQTFRGSSLQEEYSHALQRVLAAGTETAAKRQHSQAGWF